VSDLEHHQAPDGMAPGAGYSHAVSGRGRWVCHSQANGLPYFRNTGTAAKVMISGHITLVLS
jgi:hypothetical protein